MPEVVNVEAEAIIDGVSISVTFIDVNRSVGATSNYAKIHGIVEDLDNLELNQRVEVLVNNRIIFTGKLRKAVQKENGIVEIHAYDALIDAHNRVVKLNIEEPRPAYDILVDLFNDAAAIEGTFEQGSFNIAEQDDFVAGDITVNSGYGSGDRGEILKTALDDLIKKLHGVIWVDRFNAIRVTSYPDSRPSYELGYIIETNVGEEKRNVKRVIVKGGTPTGELGLAASSMYRKFSPTSFGDFGEEEEGQELTINDQNVITQKGINSLASSELYRNIRKTTIGDVTLVGNVDVQLFDDVTIPEIPTKQLYDNDVRTVKGIQHTIDANDGFKTKVTLAPHPSELDAVSGPCKPIANEFTDRIENTKEDKGTLSFIEGFE